MKALPADKTVAVALASVYDWTVYPQVSGYVLTYSPLPQAVPAVCGVLFREDPREWNVVDQDGGIAVIAFMSMTSICRS